jgi:formamidase
MTNPRLIPGRVEPRYSEFLTFIGVSVDENTGENSTWMPTSPTAGHA